MLTALRFADVAHAEASGITFERGALRTSGVTLTAPPPPASYRAVAGPRGDLTGLAASGEPVSLRGRLDAPLPVRGSLRFWLHTDRAYRSGRDAAAFTQKLIELPDALTTVGDIDCYHISYFANAPGSPRRVANLRKNSGFFLIANGPVGVAQGRPGESHSALLIKDGAHIQMGA